MLLIHEIVGVQVQTTFTPWFIWNTCDVETDDVPAKLSLGSNCRNGGEKPRPSWWKRSRPAEYDTFTLFWALVYAWYANRTLPVWRHTSSLVLMYSVLAIGFDTDEPPA